MKDKTAEKGPFDLGIFDTKKKANEGFDLEIAHPRTMEGTGLMITVLGEDSETYRKLENIQQERRVRRSVARRSNKVEVPLDEIEEDALDMIAGCVTKVWMKNGTPVNLEGKPFEFNIDSVRDLLVKYPVIRKQVEAAIKDRANFLPRSE